MRDNQKIQDMNRRRGMASTSSLFASPEAAAVKAQLLESGKKNENQDSKDGSDYYGLDIPLSITPSSNRLKIKDKNLECMVRTYSTPAKSVPTARGRWQKLQICASLCAKLEKDMNDTTLKTNSESQKHAPNPDGSPNTRAITIRSRYFSPRSLLPSTSTRHPSEEEKKTKLTTSTEYSENHLKANSENQQHFPCRPRTPSPCQDVEDGERNAQQSSSSEDGDDKQSSSETKIGIRKSLSETISNELTSHSSRFGRRLSLPANINMGGSKPHQLLPTPPLHSARFQVSNSNTSPVSRRDWDKFEQNGDSMRRRSDSSIDQESNVSLRSNLQVNRAIVSELIQQRSTVISQLNIDTNSSSEDMEGTPDGECSRPRGASFGCVSSIHEFNERRVSNHFILSSV